MKNPVKSVGKAAKKVGKGAGKAAKNVGKQINKMTRAFGAGVRDGLYDAGKETGHIIGGHPELNHKNK